MNNEPSVAHNVGYADGPEVGTRFEVATEPAIDEPLYADARLLGPDHYLAGGREPAQSFVDGLREADDRMVVFWNPMFLGGRWVIWRKQWNGEWTLVMPVFDPDTHEYWDLDNRALAILYASDPEKHGGVRQLWLQVKGQLDREKEARNKRTLDRIDEAWNAASTNSKIRVGYGHSPGNRASEHAHWDKPTKKITEKDNPLR